jgi:coenzyme PQQ precursor peptide PqqA
MEWEKPEFAEISLACEISSYANAELSVSPAADLTDRSPLLERCEE